MGIINAPGNTTVEIRQTGEIYESNDGSGWGPPLDFPVTVTNTNPSAGFLVILFTGSITFTNINNYFNCGSSYIQFGSSSLDEGGNKAIISVNVENYNGLIRNGTRLSEGENNIRVYNIAISVEGGSLQAGAGWVGQQGFGNSCTGNYVINCSTNGGLPGGATGSGGIVGSYAATGSGAELNIIGCSSSGSIGQLDGGIVGAYAGSSGGSITCAQCWSTGPIQAFGGGIYGEAAGYGGSAVATRCYSTETIGGNGGGIFSRYAGANGGVAVAQICYSRGTIGTDGGGIYGLGAGTDFTLSPAGFTTATNCYSSGTVATSGNGIYGSSKVNSTASQCYIANGSWNNNAASSSLQFPPVNGVSSTWVYRGIDIPYEIYGIGYTPYTLEIITSTPDLQQTFSQTVAQGQSSLRAVLADASGNDFDILNLTEMTAVGISINENSGTILTTAATPLGVYTIYIRSIGSYNTTVFTLTVSAAVVPTNESGVSCCEIPLDLKNADYEQRNKVISGNTMIGDSAVRRVAYTSYGALYNLKMAYASKW